MNKKKKRLRKKKEKITREKLSINGSTVFLVRALPEKEGKVFLSSECVCVGSGEYPRRVRYRSTISKKRDEAKNVMSIASEIRDSLRCTIHIHRIHTYVYIL